MAIAAIRYNNPGNVSLPIQGWTGGGNIVGITGQRGYAQFPDMQTGYLAMQQRLTNYIDVKGLSTIADLNTRYAEDQNWQNAVSRFSGIDRTTSLDTSNTAQMNALTYGIIRQETGRNPSDILGFDPRSGNISGQFADGGNGISFSAPGETAYSYNNTDGNGNYTDPASFYNTPPDVRQSYVTNPNYFNDGLDPNMQFASGGTDTGTGGGADPSGQMSDPAFGDLSGANNFGAASEGGFGDFLSKMFSGLGGLGGSGSSTDQVKEPSPTVPRAIDQQTTLTNQQSAKDTQALGKAIGGAAGALSSTQAQTTASWQATAKNLFGRAVVIIVGFIFVGVGLSMFKTTNAVARTIIPTPVQKWAKTP